MHKFLLALSLIASLATQAQAQDSAVAYQYGMDLDVAQVVSITPVADVCGPAPVEMTYLDSKGETHILQYSEFGTGCSN
ncbi:DUF2790 domain-containing protein [Pseudomonas sp. ADAK2]|uniref:DUF2790 domain-containing protein n=1 Tax=unclassified Pseudomonas TaxID=196821 RepID=UPI00146383EE|nr:MULTISPECIES: DUF2790 domain-containing protein [unclassified Pseudomonas]QJI40705.1 DUF2790 domain-containing protein [Pseudomonas sp. ADAK7]QJI47009.1 DUF2790 domain-containing protein [Pseudomonas sp. ADAK2]